MLSILPPRGPRVRVYGSLLVLFLSLTSLLLFFHDSLPMVKDFTILDNVHGGFTPNHKSTLQEDPPPQGPPYGDLVIAAQNTTDLTWTSFTKPNWTLFEYDTNNPHNADPRLQFPENKGHEAMIYLSYTIDNYDTLPWCTIFIHGHRNAWHQEDNIIQIIHDLNRTALARAGYISLRCDWYPSCPAEMRPIDHDAILWGPEGDRRGTELAIAGNWKLLFPDEKIPDTIASPCCAQFAVTRSAIRGRPKADYERIREWLVSSLLEDNLSGRVLEKVWAYMFTGNAVHCPPPQQCACEYFGQCEHGQFNKWSLPPDGLRQFGSFDDGYN